MRLHTKLTSRQVYTALALAKSKGRVAHDVHMLDTDPGAMTYQVLARHGSRSHDHSFEVQLGVDKNEPYQKLPEGYVDQFGKRQKTRRTAQRGDVYAATWHEWGWFMAEVFAVDPDAMWGHKSWGYNGVQDFDAKTKWQFDLDDECPGRHTGPCTPNIHQAARAVN